MQASDWKGAALAAGCLVLWGCGQDGTPSPPSTPPSRPPAVAAAPLAPASADRLSDSEQATVRRATVRAKAFGGMLKAALMGAMQKGGPAAAMAPCSSQAQALTESAQGDDVALGRASLRLRNPDNQPPAWVQAQLEAWGERPAAGLEPVVRKGERDMRVMIPIAVEGPCLVCHGPAESLVPEVKRILAERYPRDRATGYAVGDLRGVLWASARIEPDPR